MVFKGPVTIARHEKPIVKHLSHFSQYNERDNCLAVAIVELKRIKSKTREFMHKIFHNNERSTKTVL